MVLRSVSRGVLAGMALAALVVGPGTVSADDSDPLKRGLGQRVPAFKLPDVRTGESIALEDFEDHQAVVLVFTGVGCPIGDLSDGRGDQGRRRVVRPPLPRPAR